MQDPQAFSALLERFDPSVAELAHGVRALIVDEDPEVHEVVWHRQGTVGYGVGPRKMSEHYSYIAVHRRHVNLGFYRGARLPDPAELLGGPGVSLRHLRVESLDRLPVADVRALLRDARAERLAALGTLR